MENQKYKITIQQWNYSQPFRSPNNCNGITFINKSIDNSPSVNGYPLSYGEAFEISGNENEIDTTIYLIAIPSTGTPNLYIITKTFE